MIRNAGAMMRRTLEDAPQRGLLKVARVMSFVSAMAAALVALGAVLVLIVGPMAYFTPLRWSSDLGCAKCWKAVPAKTFILYGNPDQNNGADSVEDRLDSNCPELLKKPKDQDLSKCAWTPHRLSKEELAERFKTNFTPENLFKASVRTLLWSIPILLLARGLLEASRCLNGLSAGRYFEVATVTHLRNFATSGLFYVLLSPCVPVIGNVILHVQEAIMQFYWKLRPPGHGIHIFWPDPLDFSHENLGIGKTFSGFLVSLYALTLTIIATVMARASTIVEDHAEVCASRPLKASANT